MEFDEKGIYFKDKFILWDEIVTISTYKIDRLVVDDIILELTTENFIYSFSEDVENWRNFAEIISKKFELETLRQAQCDGCLESWYERVMKPSFQENRMLLFDRNSVR